MTPTVVSVLVPYRPAGCRHRQAAWEYVSAWYARCHPDWQVIADAGPACGASWSKGLAVATAAGRADGQVVVVADADVVCPLVTRAVEAVQAGAPWAVPHRGVFRLTEAATHSIYRGTPLPLPRPRATEFAEYHTGVAGGGMTVLPAATLARVPMDPRFRGWGQEDMAWAWALTVLAGGPWRGDAPMWHLYHPPAALDKRGSQGRWDRRRTRQVGSDEGWLLYQRYRAAGNPAAMAAILSEAAAMLS